MARSQPFIYNVFFFAGSTQCEIGDLRCLVEGIHEFSRTMDELTCQLELANSLDGTGLGPGIGGLDFDQDTDDNFSEPERQDDKDLDDIHVDLCHACSKSVPLVRQIWLVVPLFIHINIIYYRSWKLAFTDGAAC